MARRMISKFHEGGEYERLEAPTELDELRINDILESRQVPGGVSDREFFAGHCNGNQFASQPEMGDLKLRQYAQYTGGKRPPVGAVYVDSLARNGMPGDPEAWVEDRGDLKRKIESRPGSTCDGLVKAHGPEPIGPQHHRVKLAEKIVRRKLREMAEKDPSVLHRDFNEVRHEIIERHGNPHMKAEREPIEPSNILPPDPVSPELSL